jgi:V8-like Glu-specific endopeptidase
MVAPNEMTKNSSRRGAWGKRSWRGSVFIAVAAATLSSKAALALPVFETLGAPAAAPYREVLPEDTVDFTAIIALSNCSASLVRLETSLPDDQALVLTNGHCKEGGFVAPGQVVQDAPSSRSMDLLASDGKSKLGKLRADRIVYATMTKTDMMIYRLIETYGEIERKYGVRALTFQSRHPEAGRGIAVVSGYWRRIYQCAIDGFVHTLKEDGWTFSDSIRYSKPGCETIGGTSGSPIIDTMTHEVVGVNNTGNDSGKQCTMNNPCEIDADGKVTVRRGTSYGQQTYWLYGCLSADGGKLDLTQPGCELPR